MTGTAQRKTSSKPRDATVPANYLVYWRPDTVEQYCSVNERLDYAWSAQFRKVNAGDTLWIVTSRSGILFLLGRLVVRGRPTPIAQSSKQTRNDREDARLKVRARPGTAAAMQQLQLDRIAPDLTFVSATAPRLKIRRGRINPQSLQTMRRLTPESVALLSRIWLHPGKR